MGRAITRNRCTRWDSALGPLATFALWPSRSIDRTQGVVVLDDGAVRVDGAPYVAGGRHRFAEDADRDEAMLPPGEVGEQWRRSSARSKIQGSTGRVASAQARRTDEMQAVADALSLLANIVMGWNAAQIQAVLDRWANPRQIVAHRTDSPGGDQSARRDPLPRRVLHGAASTVTSCRQNKGQWLKSTSERHVQERRARGNKNTCGDKHLRAPPARNPRRCSSVDASLSPLKTNGPR